MKKMKHMYLLPLALASAVTFLAPSSVPAQGLSGKPQTITLLTRKKVADIDNYTQAAFSFKHGVNGDAALKVTRNNWDVLFGNSSFPDAFDVTMVTDDCSRIKDLGALNWSDAFDVPAVPAHPQPTREPSAKAIVGHMYVVHTKDRDNDHYALFRVESLEPGKSVTISWKLVASPGLESLTPTAGQSSNDEIKTGKLVKRKSENGVDNYVYAAYSFRFGGNGPEIQRLCRNNWDLLFGNSPTADAFDVTMVADDRSRIKDLGKYNWGDKLYIPRLPAYEEPESEPSVKAAVGHMYLVHTRDRDNNHYVLFRVERLVSEESVEITWKMIDPPPRP